MEPGALLLLFSTNSAIPAHPMLLVDMLRFTARSYLRACNLCIKFTGGVPLVISVGQCCGNVNTLMCFERETVDEKNDTKNHVTAVCFINWLLCLLIFYGDGRFTLHVPGAEYRYNSHVLGVCSAVIFIK
ncbi:hypothetical protein [Kosakonia sacchari]|uniref:Uncharacterized protein n=1 Tax=Kosakonia sacchari TaxID=1158459 RepID=A0ABZ0MNA8_9ENTR|nr:hypothetical protein [Kosakonia sacchari]WOZ76356.1 hypothetical protein Q8Y70_17420 [Kosakonia sacchari]